MKSHFSHQLAEDDKNMFLITESRIDLNKVLNEISDTSTGAVALFVGNVRDHNSRGRVSAIYYEIYKKMAENIMAMIEKETVDKWGLKKFIAIHRIGTLGVGETSVVVAVSSEHREGTFEACKYGIDSIKSRVPIWKKEFTPKEEIWVEGISLHG